ncbi:uncharacterized protein LTR77_008274 [Saxophila tyrrhenica]|uniref:Uncharacterized protein n=1 Tax=Saxophila tyrrhenica TaxID=1690608 RepID=A0AAV9P2B5_9PEZI|nr:hypothetical protein LTR77_008274 [Saxophila tyrrhenica]
MLAPRRLALIAGIFFVGVILFLNSSPYRDRLPRLPRPGSVAGASEKSRLEEEQQKVEHEIEKHLSTRPGHDDALVDAVEWTSASHGVTEPADGMLGEDTRTAQHELSATSTVSTTEARPTVKHTFKPLSSEPYKAVQSKIQELLAQWTPPAYPSHWPPYAWYGTQRDYDPNRWEGFEWENDYYINNGIEKLKEQHPATATPTPYLPYPDYNSEAWKKEWKGEFVPCEGARGKLLNQSLDDWVEAYPVIPNGFPAAAVGDADVTGLDSSHCFDRYHRFGPYGFGQQDLTDAAEWEPPSNRPNWQLVRWGDLQDQCLLKNKRRFDLNARQPTERRPGKQRPEDDLELAQDDLSRTKGAQYHSRTAVLIRSWEGYVYTSNDIENIRSLVTELSLLSGGEYQVFLFVNVKNENASIYQDEQVYKDIIQQHVPDELQDIAILWNEYMLEEWYPKIGDWQVYWHQFMPLQWFSKMYPQFDFVWNWETDARSTGNHYHFLQKIAGFAAKQPRKYLWERNARFYFPAAHGSYSAWLDDTHASIETAIKNNSMEPVWGPQPYDSSRQTPIGSSPPHPMNTDDFSWGVGEEADLITLQPIWDPVHTTWTMRDKIWNYLPGIRPHFSPTSPIDEGFTHPAFASIPRRVYINTLSRFSRRQLHAMHVENRAGRTMQAEMWPATVALQHGLKAVYAPHPIWTDRRWPAWYMDAVFNADGGEAGKWGQRGDSVYNQDREHNFAGWSWYYASDFPRILYRRWLGWGAKIGDEEQFPNNPLLELGGEEFEDEGVEVEVPGREPDGSQAAPAGGSSFGGSVVTVGGKGRMCLPAMLLHPIKRVYRGAEDDAMRDGA